MNLLISYLLVLQLLYRITSRVTKYDGWIWRKVGEMQVGLFLGSYNYFSSLIAIFFARVINVRPDIVALWEVGFESFVR
jgi:hypothetical protein